jgi:transmembrane sensor
MDKLSTRLSRLGRAVADVNEQAADPGAIPAARRRLLSTPSPERGRRFSAPAGFGLAAGLAAACAAALLFFFALRPGAVSFAIGSPPSPGAVGGWIAASRDAALPVRFSEGSSLVLAPGARMRVTETSAEGAGVLIERGKVHASIEHANRGTRWTLRAGPFEVRVVGTIFDAQWDPTTEVFELAMTEGSVTVTGPFLSSERAIVAGERLSISIREKRMEHRTAQAELPSSPGDAPPAEAAPAATPEAPPEQVGEPAEPTGGAEPKPRSSASASSATAESRPSWRELAEGGRYKDALEAAERAGFSNEVARVASASELLKLADTARLAGSPARAREALLAARQRFGARGKSAFLLGKIAADQQGAYGDAITWFEIYLREEPGGPLAEQALGRVVELRKRTDPAGARAAAERYLAQYPNGAYASVARSVLAP